MRGRFRPPCRQLKIQSLFCVGSTFEVAAFHTLNPEPHTLTRFVGRAHSAMVVLCCVACVWGAAVTLPLLFSIAAVAAAFAGRLTPLLHPLPPLPPAPTSSPQLPRRSTPTVSPPPSIISTSSTAAPCRQRLQSVQALARASLDGLVRKSHETAPFMEGRDLTTWRVNQQVGLPSPRTLWISQPKSGEPTQQQDWILKCPQGGRAETLTLGRTRRRFWRRWWTARHTARVTWWR